MSYGYRLSSDTDIRNIVDQWKQTNFNGITKEQQQKFDTRTFTRPKKKSFSNSDGKYDVTQRNRYSSDSDALVCKQNNFFSFSFCFTFGFMYFGLSFCLHSFWHCFRPTKPLQHQNNHRLICKSVVLLRACKEVSLVTYHRRQPFSWNHQLNRWATV